MKTVTKGDGLRYVLVQPVGRPSHTSDIDSVKPVHIIMCVHIIILGTDFKCGTEI